jgi:hypothetical protein
MAKARILLVFWRRRQHNIFVAAKSTHYFL